MAEYKVPQNVEAEDKLIGPFTFRQFIYLIVVVLAGTLAWALSRLFLPLGLIPLPIILLFGALALPLRKDQPMEVYLAALVSFYLKPRNRLWDPDGVESTVEITAPKAIEQPLTKDLSQDEARQRLGYLAEVVDSGGRNILGPAQEALAGTSLNSDIFYEAEQARDFMDNDTSVSQLLDQRLKESAEKRRQEAVELMKKQAFGSQTGEDQDSNMTMNPYPEYMQQAILPTLSGHDQPQPLGQSSNPAIIDLATNTPDLSVQTIASEANRLQGESSIDEGVVVNFR